MDTPTPSETNKPEEKLIKKKLVKTLIVVYSLTILLGLFLALKNRPSSPALNLTSQAAGFLKFSKKGTVGVVKIHGPIYFSDSAQPWEDAGAESWERQMIKLSKRRDVKAIVLDINSPGGSVGAVQELYSEILRIRKTKHIPFVASFGDVAASGGYYLASACDKIVAHPGTLTGSIGVIFDATDLQGLFHKIGVKMSPIKSGKFKDIGSPARAMTPAEKDLLQKIINDTYEQFLSAVSLGRNIPLEKLRPIADGRIFSGNQALKDHLVDQLGDFHDAVALAARLGGIPGKPRVIRGGGNFDQILELLNSRFLGNPVSAASLIGKLEMPRAGLEYLWTGY